MDLFSDKLHEECGVVAIYGHPEASKLAYLSLYALQHRGQESAGIASSNGERLFLHKSMGLVSDIFTADALARVPGSLAIGHTRYSTTGDSALLNAQPIMVECNKGKIALAHNGNITNAAEIRAQLDQQGSIFQTTSDTEVIVHLMARSREQTLADAMADSLRRVEGAFSLVMLTSDRVFAARDPRGFRPLVMGRISGTGSASRRQHRLRLRDLRLRPDRRNLRARGEAGRAGHRWSRRCAFALLRSAAAAIELHLRARVFLAARQHGLRHARCRKRRDAMGRQLALESPVDADIVVPVPDSGVTAAMGFSHESGIPLQFGLIRNHYVGRTFIEPEQRVRDFGVKLKLNPVRHVLAGKRVVLIDDSIVRGTTSKKIVRMVRDAGAKEVHMRISCPPTISPCYYGVDTPSKNQLIAANKSVDEIREYIGADSLAYLSLEGLRKAAGEGEQKRLLHRLLHR